MKTVEIGFKRTALGWYNVTMVATGARYNVAPQIFHATVGASENAYAGRTEIDGTQLMALMTDRWTRRLPQEGQKAAAV